MNDKLDEVRKSLAAAAGKAATEIKTAVGEGLETVRVAVREALATDRELTPEQLDEKYNPDGVGEHPVFTRALWKKAVADDETFFGYWQWVSWMLRK